MFKKKFQHQIKSVLEEELSIKTDEKSMNDSIVKTMKEIFQKKTEGSFHE